MTTSHYCYPVSDEDLIKNPELVKVNRIIIRHKNKIIGIFGVRSCDLVVKAELNAYGYPTRSSRHKADTKYILFSFDAEQQNIEDIDINSFTPILGRGIK